jgi:hypothetical protein
MYFTNRKFWILASSQYKLQVFKFTVKPTVCQTILYTIYTVRYATRYLYLKYYTVLHLGRVICAFFMEIAHFNEIHACQVAHLTIFST